MVRLSHIHTLTQQQKQHKRWPIGTQEQKREKSESSGVWVLGKPTTFCCVVKVVGRSCESSGFFEKCMWAFFSSTQS